MLDDILSKIKAKTKHPTIVRVQCQNIFLYLMLFFMQRFSLFFSSLSFLGHIYIYIYLSIPTEMWVCKYSIRTTGEKATE